MSARAMLLPGEVVIANSGNLTLNFATRDEGGEWDNSCHVASGQNETFRFETPRFEIFIKSDNGQTVQKLLACQQRYLLFFNSAGAWDIKLAD